MSKIDKTSGFKAKSKSDYKKGKITLSKLLDMVGNKTETKRLIKEHKDLLKAAKDGDPVALKNFEVIYGKKPGRGQMNPFTQDIEDILFEATLMPREAMAGYKDLFRQYVLGKTDKNKFKKEIQEQKEKFYTSPVQYTDKKKYNKGGMIDYRSKGLFK